MVVAVRATATANKIPNLICLFLDGCPEGGLNVLLIQNGYKSVDGPSRRTENLWEPWSIHVDAGATNARNPERVQRFGS